MTLFFFENAMRKNLNIYAFYALLAISWLVSNHYFPWLAFHSDWVACAAVVISFVILLNRGQVEVPFISIIFLAVSIIPIFQYYFGLIYFKGDAIVVFLYIFLAALAACIGFNFLGGKDEVYKYFAVFVLIAGLISMWVALGQWLSVDSLGLFSVHVPFNGRVYANFAQPNQFATFIMLNFCGIFYLYYKRDIGTSITVVLLIFFAWGLALAQSRAGFLELIVFFILGLVFYNNNKRLIYFFIASLIIFLAIWYIFLPITSDFLEFSELRKDKASIGTRYIHWQTAISAIFMAPWFGYGWNQVSVALAKTVTNYPSTHEFIEHTHNLILDVIIWNGIPISLLLFAIIIKWLCKFVFFKTDIFDKFVVLFLSCFLVHSMLEFPLEYAYFLMPFSFLLGSIEKKKSDAKYFKINNVFVRKLIAPSILLSCLIWVGYDYLNVESNVQNLRLEDRGLVIDANDKNVNNIKLFDQQKNYILFARTTAKENMSEEQLEWMRKISERYGHAPALFRYALAAGLNNRPQDATNSLIRICKTSSSFNCSDSENNWNNLRLKYDHLPNYPSIAKN
ncbi:O-antigen ligase C-terminal domain-containing protein [Comamonas sp. Y33R10-2]|uniref:PglL family O-oligosaccharyltransferase n=1 Tax=Comamonas sp. Y33R10-2 TaxID=2853257 RepID=UPI001C5CB373|nr:O-antigen ligase family protein [Comamonas sp. Y33R10-2]QXZ08647.1 O-antigen ligase C-terminal domain-containing protein [Comamonas sp. Y33R10-2]